MSRALIILRTTADRAKASNWIAKGPAGTRVEFKSPKRSLPQNDKMWAMLTEVAEQQDWHGVKLTTNGWKDLFLDALGREMKLVPNLDNTGFVNIGKSSSDLSVEEMTNMIELMFAFGANPDHPVTFSDGAPSSQAAHLPAGEAFPSSRVSPATHST